MNVCQRCRRELPEPRAVCPACGATAVFAGVPRDPVLGTTIAGGRYLVRRLLGEGGMGRVYEATHVALDRRVALKVMHEAHFRDPSIAGRFEREARAVSRLAHANVVTVLDFGSTESGTPFMVMEYLSGRPLSEILREQFPLAHERVVRIVAQILSAVAHAHAHGILHRDLKPDNVMIEARDDEPDFVKVLDFGIAKVLDPAGGNATLTEAGFVCGTPRYMSPEQARGERLDPRSDLYAVGVILYEMLAGRPPFDAPTPMGLAAKHIVESPTPPSALRSDVFVPPDLERLAMSALAKDREDRPRDATEMRTRLVACRLGGGTGAIQASPGAADASPGAVQAGAGGTARIGSGTIRIGGGAVEISAGTGAVGATPVPATPTPEPQPVPIQLPQRPTRKFRWDWSWLFFLIGPALVVGFNLSFNPAALEWIRPPMRGVIAAEGGRFPGFRLEPGQCMASPNAKRPAAHVSSRKLRAIALEVMPGELAVTGRAAESASDLDRRWADLRLLITEPGKKPTYAFASGIRIVRCAGLESTVSRLGEDTLFELKVDCQTEELGRVHGVLRSRKCR